MAKTTLAAAPVMPAQRGQPGRWSFNAAMGLIGGFGLLMLIGPTLIVLVTSLTSGYSLKFPPPGLSLRWYEALIFDSPEIIDDLLLSLKLAAAATACATVVAVAAAVTLARRRTLAARLLDSFFMAPLTIPSLALGLGILILFNLESAGLSFYSLLAGHIALCAVHHVGQLCATRSRPAG
jgi:putative spermidine/putrescine transport system permease protein